MVEVCAPAVLSTAVVVAVMVPLLVVDTWVDVPVAGGVDVLVLVVLAAGATCAFAADICVPKLAIWAALNGPLVDCA